MKNIVLLCAQGMSTGVLVTKMRTEANNQDYSCEIKAMAVDKLSDALTYADVILLGPQVKYELDNVKNKAGNIPVEVIDMISYGMLDGKKVLNRAKELLGGFDE